MQYLSALEMCSRQGAIQIHVYLYLTFTILIQYRCEWYIAENRILWESFLLHN